MKRLKLFLLLLLLLLPVNVQAQTLVHPQKVYINPNGVGGTDALKIDGGLRAGPAGSVQVINADGSISVSATIGDGTIQKIKLGNDCATGQILIRNSSGTPAYWDCGNVSSAGGLAAGDNNITITGTGWRFQNATVFGSSTTAQELIHVYNSGGDAGIQIQNNAQAWKLLATGNALRMQNGTNYPLTLTTTQVGIFNTTPTAGYEVDITGDVRISGNILNLGSFGNHLYPTTSDALDIGTYNTKWRNLFVGSAIFDQFIQQNVQLYNGYQIIGKESGSFNSAVSNVATTFVADEDHEIGDYILIRGRDAAGNFGTEYVVITNKSGAGPYTYTVTRNLDGSGANSWNADTQYLVLGKQYDGRIELYAASGIPSIRVVTQGASYSAFDSLVHLGGLDGITGVNAARYGLYVGKQDGTGDYLKFQNYLGSPSGDDGKLIVKGGLVAGSYLVSNTSINLSASGLDVGTTGRITGGRGTYNSDTSGFWLGYDSGAYKFYIGNADETKYLQWDGSNLTIRGTLNASDITTGTLNASLITVSNLNASSITTGTLSASYISGGILNAGLMTVTNLDAGSITTGTLSANRIGAGTIVADKIHADAINGKTITGATIRTASSGARVEMNGTNLRSIDSDGTALVTLDGTGISVVSSTSGLTVDKNAYRFTNALSGYGAPGSFGLYSSVSGGTTSYLELPNVVPDDGANNKAVTQIWAMAVGATHRAASVNLYSPSAAEYSAGTLPKVYLAPVVGVNTLSPTSGYTLDVNGHAYIRADLRVDNIYVDGSTITTLSGPLYINPAGTSRVNFTDTDITAAGIEITGWVAAYGDFRTVCTSATSTGADSFIYFGPSNSSCNASSIHYKTNVQPAYFDWTRILDVTPVTFEYKTSLGKAQFGLIAEDVEALGLEPLVARNDKGEVEAVHYDKVALYLIPVVREQRAQIAALERRIEALERRK